MNKLYIIGFGVGDEKFLTGKAIDAIKEADTILSTSRLIDSLIDCHVDSAHSNKNVKICKLSELMTEIEGDLKGITAVLVSGDCGFFSASKSIIKRFSDKYNIELINGISSIQYLSSKLAVSYDDAILCTMHGRDEINIVPKVAYNRKVFLLTGGENKAHNICKTLVNSGLADVKIHIGESLSYPDERIVNGTPRELMGEVFGDLSVMYIENNSFASPHLPLNDDDFIRGDVPMTKQEVRWLSLQKLGLSPSDIVYDIGAGTGSVSIEMARKVYDGFVYAVEKNEEACSLIEENKNRHSAFNIDIIKAEAPYGLEYLPAPDKVFIGGNSGQMHSILSELVKKNRQVRVVSNAITLQTLNSILEEYKSNGLTKTDVICVNISKSKKVNNYDMMIAQNPVYIVTGESGGVVE